MSSFWFYFKAAVSDLWTNKGRSFLTSLGIIIGVYSVILLLSLGEGLKVYIQQQFDSLGSNLIFVIPGKLDGANTRESMTGGAKFDQTDYQKLENGLSEAMVVPMVMRNALVVSRKDSVSTSLLGSTQKVAQIYNLKLANGRFFSRSEELSGRKVIVLGSKIAEDLFNGPAVGQTIDVNDLKFKVVGILESKGGGGLGGPSFDDYAYSPYKALYLLSNDRSFYSFYLRAEDDSKIDIVIAKAERILLKTHKEEDFSISTQEELLDTISSIFTMINGVLVGIAAISLLVGGVGITNIMYVTVTERTKEIGIRRAVGAEESNILLQFVSLSILLTFVGGLVGVVLACLTTLIIYPFFPATITVEAIIIAFVVCVLIGIIFGVFPARKAAKLSPVEAIRYE
jgi:putative ABC transport system permease protein